MFAGVDAHGNCGILIVVDSVYSYKIIEISVLAP